MADNSTPLDFNHSQTQKQFVIHEEEYDEGGAAFPPHENLPLAIPNEPFDLSQTQPLLAIDDEINSTFDRTADGSQVLNLSNHEQYNENQNSAYGEEVSGTSTLLNSSETNKNLTGKETSSAHTPEYSVCVPILSNSNPLSSQNSIDQEPIFSNQYTRPAEKHDILEPGSKEQQSGEDNQGSPSLTPPNNASHLHNDILNNSDDEPETSSDIQRKRKVISSYDENENAHDDCLFDQVLQEERFGENSFERESIEAGENGDVYAEDQLEVREQSVLPGAENVGELMANIFGDDADSDDNDESRLLNRSGGSDAIDPGVASSEQIDREDDGGIEQDSYGRKWDFDLMMSKKKSLKKRRRRKDRSFDLISDADDQIKELVDAMTEAANDDRLSNENKRPAIRKLKMLPIVRSVLLRADWFDALLDNGMMNAISEWLAPLPDKSLPALEIRSTLLKILDSFPQLEQGILKQSGIGKAIMILLKHPKEIKDNRIIASRLIREWSRPIFQSETDLRSLTREERLQRDFFQMPESKRQRLRVDDDGLPIPNLTQAKNDNPQSTNQNDNPVSSERIIFRARVPKPSTRDYVIRPKPEIEGFRGDTKNRHGEMEKKLRLFRERSRQNIVRRTVGVSIEGKKVGL